MPVHAVWCCRDSDGMLSAKVLHHEEEVYTRCMDELAGQVGCARGARVQHWGSRAPSARASRSWQQQHGAGDAHQAGWLCWLTSHLSCAMRVRRWVRCASSGAG